MAQQALGCHHHERLAPATLHLPAQAVEVLSGSRWVDDLDVIIRRETQKAFQAGARMLRPLPFKAVRQQEKDAAEPPPFVLGAGDKLIDDDLGRIPKIAKLRLPKDQSFRVVEAVSIFETQHSRFRERAVVNFD